MQDSANRERASTKVLIEDNGCSIFETDNAGDALLSPCPKEAKLENQFGVAALDKVPTWPFLAIHGSTALVNPCTSMWDIRIMQEQLSRITIVFVLRLDLIS
jgi:hypothetical protein